MISPEQVRATFVEALDQSERAVINWREGRVAPNTVNRWRFTEMLDASNNVLALAPAIGDVVESDVIARLREVNAWLKAIVEVGLAQEALEQLTLKLGELAERRSS